GPARTHGRRDAEGLCSGHACTCSIRFYACPPGIRDWGLGVARRKRTACFRCVMLPWSNVTERSAMKANKALKRLAKIEALISDVAKRYSSGAANVRKALQDAKAAVAHLRAAGSFRAHPANT